MGAFDPSSYETVDERIRRFYTDHAAGRITTELVDAVGDVGKTRWVVKASVWRDVSLLLDVPDGTGYAFEVDGTGMANRTSALENCETSAIGRALANIGYSGSKRPTREEMRKTQTPPADPGVYVGRMRAAGSMGELQEAWEAAGRAGVASTPAVVAVKDQRKAELTDG